MPAVWLMPAAEDAEPLRRQIAALAARHQSMPFEPHLTLASLPDLPLPELEDRLRAAARRFGPVRLRIQGASWSPFFFRALVLEAGLAPGLHALREAVAPGAGGWQPHVSLLYGEHTPAALETAAAALEYPAQIRFDALLWAAPAPPEQDWRQISRWRLGARIPLEC
ncbi:MAG: 2'-5' RNA ligase family protein [Bacteroidia bacterium]|nr:2'-5' RNA ligase family protein [Bacteroidia bacterium]